MKLNEYEILGASRPYHFTAPNSQVATVAMMFLGEGRYGFRNLKDAEDNLPIFRIAGSHDDWCKKRFGMAMSELVSKVSRTKELVTAMHRALESVTLGLPGDSGIDRPPEYRDLEIQAKEKAEKIAREITRAVVKNQRRQ